MRKKTETIWGKHPLTEDELKQYANELAVKIGEKSQHEDELKSFRSQMKANIDETDAKINRFSEVIRNKYEYRNIECEIEVDPKQKIKSYYDIETGELISTRKMNPDDFQEDLEL